MRRLSAWLYAVLFWASGLLAPSYALHGATTTNFIPLKMGGATLSKVVLDKTAFLKYRDAFRAEFDRYIFLRDFLECVPSGNNLVNVESVKFFNTVTYNDVHYAIACALGYYFDGATETIKQARSTGNEEFWYFASDDEYKGGDGGLMLPDFSDSRNSFIETLLEEDLPSDGGADVACETLVGTEMFKIMSKCDGDWHATRRLNLVRLLYVKDFLSSDFIETIDSHR